MACRGQATALDRGKVSPHAVHFTDGGTGGEQGATDRLLVVERKSLGGRCQKGRAPAGDQCNDEIVGREPSNEILNASSGGHTGRVGDRMRCLDNLDALAGSSVAVARDDQTA